DFTIASFLEHERWHAETSELTSLMDECIGIFLHSVTDEGQGADLQQFSFLLGMGEDLTYLGFPGRAHDLRHGFGQLGGVRDPAGGAAFTEAAVVEELHVELADGGDFAEHIGLEGTGGIPGWLPASGGVEGEDEAAVPGRCAVFDQVLEKRVDFGGTLVLR